MPHSVHSYKILVISDYRDLNSSRPEAEIFVELANRGHKIHILSYPDAKYYNERFRANGIKVIENHPVKKASLSYIRYLRELVRGEQYDFVHAFNSYGLTNAVWALLGLKSKLIAYRGFAGQTYWHDPTMYAKYFHPRVDHIICLSEEIEQILSRNMPWAKNKLTTIHKGHNPVWYENVIPLERSALGFNQGDTLISCVANVRPFKGIPYLIESTYYLPHEPVIHFLLIGKGYDEEPLKSMIAKCPYSKNIHVMGFRNDSLSIVAACDALILTSTHGEALTKSVIEAMCLGIPPIVTDIPGNYGLVINGESGWVLPPADPLILSRAIMAMVRNRDETKRRGQNAKEQIRRHFHTENTVAEYLKLYARLEPLKN